MDQVTNSPEQPCRGWRAVFGVAMAVVGVLAAATFITERAVIERILAHLANRANRATRPGTPPSQSAAARDPPSTSRTRRRRTRSRRVDAGEPV